MEGKSLHFATQNQLTSGKSSVKFGHYGCQNVATGLEILSGGSLGHVNYAIKAVLTFLFLET